MDSQQAIMDKSSLFINRELSWIRFNRHVLDEARDETHPLLERVKFLAIFANNLDEFFMIRVSGLQRQLAKGVLKSPPDGMTPSQQLDGIRKMLIPELETQYRVWHDEILPRLDEAGIHIHMYSGLTNAQKDAMHTFFVNEVFPVLTPLAFDSSHPFPFISNLSLNLAIVIRDPAKKEYFARVKVPTNLFSRLVRIPGPGTAGTGKDADVHLIYLEEIIAAHLDMLFPGMEVIASFPFRITRDADLEIEVDEASDLLTTVEEIMEQRARGKPVRIEMECGMHDNICHMLEKKLGVPSDMIYRIGHPVGMADLMQLMSLDRPDLKDIPFAPSVAAELGEGKDIFAAIRDHDILLYHPYDSFTPVVNFLQQAARDPDVLGIKITLYRVGSNSPVVNALMEARENGKAVAALIELKARFDEENNIGWARALEHLGVHVVYGVVGLKVHAKLCMVVRREKDGIRRYVHLGTGNYNATTSRIYTDFGMLTADRAIGDDVANLFNFLTGYARIEQYRKLLVAPVTLRKGIIDRIDREISHHREHGDGHLVFKMNALVDPICIEALYRASQAGVRIDLQVRGICCLRPGIPGISDTIRVTAIVGRFLEHARIYYFRNGGNEEVFLGSADLMPRNLDRRVEVLYPVETPVIRDAIKSRILPVQLGDNVKVRTMQPDGTYTRRQPGSDEKPLNAQTWFVEHRGTLYDPTR
ncbi:MULTISPECIES: polyphosphate kinase 1 [unclassified Methanoregula]|uniref:polyphosphate kinase 1 n=1 Tax=unclassified Methanoregula TaxID=2649730 RepID=UPI0009C5D7FD|nr:MULTISPECIES: polyphosphate kinase 1 [unclassified Methanoregula]OPX65032.1 MAG: polyphosphate kinase [Methanoregula sp. PtaB.Bin085]OPY32364.1 MAG: polyphosphate kinase [Methanoregula sp. PtaU1.Bin006]